MGDFDVDLEFSKFWDCYDGRLLCGANSKKGGKSQALKSYKRKVKDQEFATKLLNALIAQKKQHAIFKKKAETDQSFWVPNFSMVSTYINQEKWDTELDDLNEAGDESKRRAALSKCNIPGCDEEVHGQKFKQCSHHTTANGKFKNELLNGLKSRGLGKLKSESTEEWIARLKEANHGGISKIKKMDVKL